MNVKLFDISLKQYQAGFC